MPVPEPALSVAVSVDTVLASAAANGEVATAASVTCAPHGDAAPAAAKCAPPLPPRSSSRENGIGRQEERVEVNGGLSAAPAAVAHAAVAYAATGAVKDAEGVSPTTKIETRECFGWFDGQQRRRFGYVVPEAYWAQDRVYGVQ